MSATKARRRAMFPDPEHARFGFRRRCSWCARVLRGWQLNLCRRCSAAAMDPWAGPPFPQASQWKGAPDQWRRNASGAACWWLLACPALIVAVTYVAALGVR